MWQHTTCLYPPPPFMKNYGWSYNLELPFLYLREARISLNIWKYIYLFKWKMSPLLITDGLTDQQSCLSGITTQQDILLYHLQHLLLCLVPKTREIIMIVVFLSKEYNALWFPHLPNFLLLFMFRDVPWFRIIDGIDCDANSTNNGHIVFHRISIFPDGRTSKFPSSFIQSSILSSSVI